MPSVSRPASSPFPLGLPRQGLSCGTSQWLSQHVPYPSPSPSFHFPFCWDLLRTFSQADIADPVWPMNFLDSLDAAADA